MISLLLFFLSPLLALALSVLGAILANVAYNSAPGWLFWTLWVIFMWFYISASYLNFHRYLISKGTNIGEVSRHDFLKQSRKEMMGPLAPIYEVYYFICFNASPFVVLYLGYLGYSRFFQ